MSATDERVTDTVILKLTHDGSNDAEEIVDESLAYAFDKGLFPGSAAHFVWSPDKDEEVKIVPADGMAVSLTREEWGLVCQAMAAAKRGWTADYDYADDLADKIGQQVWD